VDADAQKAAAIQKAQVASEKTAGMVLPHTVPGVAGADEWEYWAMASVQHSCTIAQT
jgi:hypothetical protein